MGNAESLLVARAYATCLRKQITDNIKTRNGDAGAGSLPKEAHLPHLVWMCDEIISNLVFTPSKAHRWIGFIQGVLIVRGLQSVAAEHEQYVEAKTKVLTAIKGD